MKILHLIFYIILLGYIYAIDVVKKNDSFYDKIITQSAAVSGSIFFDYSYNFIEFSNGKLYNGLLRHNYINIYYNRYNFFLLFNRINDIPNTNSMWLDNGDDFPSISEIDYSSPSFFSYKNFIWKFSRIDKNFVYTIKFSNSSILSNASYGLGFNISYSNDSILNINYRIKIYDLLSFKKWDTNNLEVFIPSSEIIIQKNIYNHIFGVGLFLNDDDIDYKFGLHLKLIDDFSLFFGRDYLYSMTTGFKFDRPTFSFSYAYMIPNKDIPFNPSQQFSVSVYFDSFISKKSIGLRP